MNPLPVDPLLLQEPTDYFSGIGGTATAPPTSVLLFFRMSRAALQQKALQNRSHHRHVLILNMGVPGTVHLDHRAVRLVDSDALLVLPFQFHHFSNVESETLRWLFCTFEVEDPSRLERFRNRSLVSNAATVQARDDLLSAWRSGLTTNWRPAPLEQRVQIQLQRLLTELEIVLHESEPGGEHTGTGGLLDSVHRIVSQSRGECVTVDDVAVALKRSTSGLRAEFRRVAGVPLGAYIRNVRINRALSLLRNSSQPINEIATESGFSSPQTFSRAIKQHTGRCPRSYRQ